MAEYRPIKQKIWHDNWFLSLDSNEKLLWLFLLTNEFTDISGIYELPDTLISPLTKIDNYEKILKKFEKEGKIKIRNGYIFIRNYLKNQTKQINKKDNIIKSIIKYLSENTDFIKLFDLQNEDPYKPLILNSKSGTSPLPKVVKSKEESNKEERVLQPAVAESVKSKNDDDDLLMDLQQFVEWCNKSPHKHIIIIADYAEEKSINYTTKGQWKQFIKRNVRPAKQLVPYTDEQKTKAMIKIEQAQGEYLKKWTLETLLKYLD